MSPYRRKASLTLLAAALLGAAAPIFAAESAELGSTAASFLKIGVGARPAALGEAFAGLCDDVNAIAYNPAGLATLRRQELSLMHHELYAGVRQEWMSYAFPSERLGSFAFSVNVLHVQPFEAYDGNDQLLEKISAQDSAYGVAYARRLGRSLSLGAGFKYLRSQLSDRTATATAFDLGATLDTPVEGLRLGVSALNMGGGMKFIDESYDLPLAGKAGLSYKLSWRADRPHEINAAADMTVYRDRSPFAAFGLEYVRHNALALRAGWRGHQDQGTGLTLGAGLTVNRSLKARLPEISFDYAFVGLGDAAQSHRASVTLKFGKPRWLREPAEPAARAQTAPRAPRRPRRPSAYEPVPEESERAPKPERKTEDLMWVNP